ncbi:MAG TPA: hypothetical protein VGC81_05295 [Candidatus Methylomirabilis sp.]|jgi:hypothetical protein
MPQHDPLELTWIDMTFRELHNQAMSIYLGSPGRFTELQDLVCKLSIGFNEFGGRGASSLRCPPNFHPCGPMLNWCCPDICQPPEAPDSH